jgi:hypothetical protein
VFDLHRHGVNMFVSSHGLGNSAPPATAGDPRALFELREKRGKDAQEWFEHQYSDGGPWDPGEDANESNSYTNHYSQRLNRCYTVVSTSRVLHVDEKSIRMKAKRLVDVNENKEMGVSTEFSDATTPKKCEVADRECRSEWIWDSLADSYMAK